jgi:hypothetical protein
MKRHFNFFHNKKEYKIVRRYNAGYMLTYCNSFFYELFLCSYQLWNDLKWIFTMNLCLKPRYDIEAAKYVDVDINIDIDTDMDVIELRKEE